MTITDERLGIAMQRIRRVVKEPPHSGTMQLWFSRGQVEPQPPDVLGKGAAASSSAGGSEGLLIRKLPNELHFSGGYSQDLAGLQVASGRSESLLTLETAVGNMADSQPQEPAPLRLSLPSEDPQQTATAATAAAVGVSSAVATTEAAVEDPGKAVKVKAKKKKQGQGGALTAAAAEAAAPGEASAAAAASNAAAIAGNTRRQARKKQDDAVQGKK